MKRAFPIVSISLALVTLVASFTVATMVHGSPWSSVTVRELRNYGGVDNGQLAAGQWWRLITAQFVHVNQTHMLFSVVTLFLFAAVVEQATGAFVLTLVWLLSGVAGIFASIYSVLPPWDIGSGASQALMGVAAAAIVAIWRNHPCPRWVKGTLVLTLLIQSGLDLVSAHRLKPGHIVGFLVGLVLAAGLVRNVAKRPVGDLS